LAVLCIIGTITAYEDIRIGKVKNKLILIGFSAGIIGYLLLAGEVVCFSAVGSAYFKKLLINIFVSCLVSFFIWYAGLWAAGDAKVFMLFSFLFPLRYYGDRWVIPFFPAANLLVNAFVLTLIFVFLEIIFKTVKFGLGVILRLMEQTVDSKRRLSFLQWKVAARRIKTKKAEYFKVVVTYLCFFMLFDVARGHIKGIPVLEDFGFIIIILVFRPIRNIFHKVKLSHLLLVIGAVWIYKFYLSRVSLSDFFVQSALMLRNYAVFMPVIFVIFGVIDLYIKSKEEVRINVDDLSSRMVLSLESTKAINQYLIKEGVEEKFYADGLTQRQVEYIKGLSLKNNFNEISIYKTFPLVPFVFLGVLATIAAKGVILDLGLLTSAFKMFVGRML